MSNDSNTTTTTNAALDPNGPTRIYYGKRSTMQAELGVPDFYEGEWLILPYGDAQYDAEGAKNAKEARQFAISIADDVERNGGKRPEICSL